MEEEWEKGTIGNPRSGLPTVVLHQDSGGDFSVAKVSLLSQSRIS